MLVGAELTCKLADFGVARDIARDATMTVTGSPMYCAPEVIRGEKYDEACE